MHTQRNHIASARTTRTSRRAATVAVLALGLTGLAGCAEDPAEPVVGAVTDEDVAGLEEQIGGLEERVGVLEEDLAAVGPGGSDEQVAAPLPAVNEQYAEILENPQSFLGEEVTLGAEVIEILPTADAGIAFRMGGTIADPITVISATPPPAFDANDIVRVTGTMVEVQADTFEQDFGIAGDALFDDPDAFFGTAEGQPAISADQIEILNEEAGS